MPKKQSEAPSKRQIRKEELRKRETQQRKIMIGVIAGIAVLLLAVIIIPSIQRANNPAGDFKKITPLAYTNTAGKGIGNPDAKIKIEVFEDFQCDACKTYAEDYEPLIVRQIVDNQDVYYVFHQYPFLDDRSTEKGSDRAALASECAAEQDRFWDYKTILFANQTGIQGQYSRVRLVAFADSLGLNMEQFESCLDSAKYQSELDAGIALGDQLGVAGTPSVFVNGQPVSPGAVPSFDQINAAVQQILQGG